jgi:hypothetical protein
MQKERNHKRGRRHRQPDAIIAKRYALTPSSDIISGLYTLLPLTGEMIAKSDALLVKLDVIADNYANGP